MDDEKRATASAPGNDAAPPRPPSAPAPVKGETKAAAADLDLAVEEIVRPELMKEGFVGQER